jgi:serine protease Do
MVKLAEFSHQITSLVHGVRQSVVGVQGERGSGAGVVIGDGLVVTAAHVIAQSRQCSILGERRWSRIIAVREDCDLALLDTGPLGRPPLQMAGAVRVGELVIAVGSGLGVEGLSTVGIVSGFAGQFQVGDRTIRDVIKADVASARGNSGGALANVNGQLVGIILAGTREGGLTVCIGANRVRDMIDAVYQRT